MHNQARNFTLFIKHFFPQYFHNVNVLDVGSGDINGNNRYLFDELCKYQGNDVYPAKNVTIVSPTSKLDFANNTFDVIVSTECFEHDPEYALSWRNIYRMLKEDGIFFFTCASDGRAEHGTRRTCPSESYGTVAGLVEWQDYYKNLNLTHLKEVFDLDNEFSSWHAYYDPTSFDLYFWGIKRGKIPSISDIPDYTHFVESVTKLGSHIYAITSELQSVVPDYSKLLSNFRINYY